MKKRTRWTRWVISESANPNVPLPWQRADTPRDAVVSMPSFAAIAASHAAPGRHAPT